MALSCPQMALADEQGKAFLLEEEVRDLREQLEDFQKVRRSGRVEGTGGHQDLSVRLAHV